jgi:7-carboxy-7-deazaguanine synthase
MEQAQAPEAKVKRIPVVEMFGPTVQGEGELCGMRTHFVRFGLCDYKCVKCDSLHAVDPHSVKAIATWMTEAEICNRLIADMRASNTKWVTLSGGNPCIHDLSMLATHLHAADIKISVETQGTFAPAWLDLADQITVSPKSEGMGEKLELDKLDKFMRRVYKKCNPSLKVVVFSAQDLETACMLKARYPGHEFFMSLGNPYPPHLGEGEVVDFAPSKEELLRILTENYGQLIEEIKDYPTLADVKFLPQMHVLLWGNERAR